MGDGFTVINATADVLVGMPIQVRVPCWKAAKLRQLMRGRYYIMIHVLGTKNELVELILLREFTMPEIYLSSTGLQPNPSASVGVGGVYPSLTMA